MLKRLVDVYKIPFLLSATLAIILSAVKFDRNIISTVLIFLGSFIGTFLLDLDYLIYAYFVEPEVDYSKTVKGYFSHKDVIGGLTYIYYHKKDVKERTLNSGLFQVILAGIAIFIISSDANLVIKALILSSFLNSFYRFVENYYEGAGGSDWFWAFKIKPSKLNSLLYFISLSAAFIYSIYLF